MKRFISLTIMLAMCIGLLPAAHGAEGELALRKIPMEEVNRTCEEQGLQVTWFPEYEGLMRRYGTDRMLLVKGGLSYLAVLGSTEILAGPFDAVEEFDGSGQAYAAKNGKWGIIDLDGNTVMDFTYDTLHNAKERVTAKPVMEPGGWKYAIADMNGNLLTPYKYWDVHPGYSNGMLGVFIGQDEEGNDLGWGFVNEKGEEVIPCQFYQGGIGAFDENGYVVLHGNLLDKTGRLLFENYFNDLWYAGCGLYAILDNKKVGFIDKSGNVVIEPQYSKPTYDPKGIMQGCKFDETTGLAAVALNGESFYIDTQGNRVEDNVSGSTTALHEGLKIVTDVGSNTGFGYDFGWPYGFADKNGNVVVPVMYAGVGDFDRGYAVVKVGEVFGLLKNPLKRDAVSDWAKAEVEKATEVGLVTGDCAHYQTYTITRAQFASLAVNYLEKMGENFVPASQDTFTDTTDEAVLKAYTAGIVQGVGDGRFAPDDLLNREQLAAMLWRALKQIGATEELKTDLSAYTDNSLISDWAAEALSCIVSRGIMTGTGADQLSPKAPCTVEQAVLMVCRTYSAPQVNC